MDSGYRRNEEFFKNDLRDMSKGWFKDQIGLKSLISVKLLSMV